VPDATARKCDPGSAALDAELADRLESASVHRRRGKRIRADLPREPGRSCDLPYQAGASRGDQQPQPEQVAH
jgi:hypothetical protein